MGCKRLAAGRPSISTKLTFLMEATVMNQLPPDDSERALLHNEVHARPSARIRIPAVILLVGVFNDGISREQECEHLPSAAT